jgi:DNA repair exonuclease SbcCD nuclease subunit
MVETMSKPIAVLCSDVHYSLPTLELADKSMRMAIDKSKTLGVPLIVAGDLHDTKANMRGECVNAMIETFGNYARYYVKGAQVIVLIGNHDKINEKSQAHSLNFLKEVQLVIDYPMKVLGLYLIPYHHNPDELRAYLKTIPPKSTLIMHQGLTSSISGEYIQDKSAINAEDVAGFRVISGHYHYRQTKQLPDGGVWDYIGNPYTLNYGEANDPPKGFQILMDDGSLEFVPTNLRKHIVITHDLQAKNSNWSSTPAYHTSDRKDLIWVRISGSSEKIAKLDKTSWAEEYGIPKDCRFTTTAIDSTAPMPQTTKEVPQDELLDSIIDSLTDADSSRKARLKGLWKDLVDKG